MSNALTRAARPLAMEPAEKAVLMALADMARDADDPASPCQAWPPMHGQDGALGLCEWTCLSERTIQRAIKALVAAGHVTRRQLSHGALYTVHPAGASSSTDALASPVTVSGDTQSGDMVSGDTVTPSPVTVSSSPVTVTPKAPISTSKPNLSSTREAGFVAIASGQGLPALPVTASPAQWADYAAMRVGMTRGTKPKPWTASIARKAIERLHALATQGNDAGAVLDASVLNGWQGLFPVKESVNGRSQHFGGGGAARADRGRPVDGFMSALREVGARGGSDDFSGG